MSRHRRYRSLTCEAGRIALAAALGLVMALLAPLAGAIAQVAVVTHHYDNFRTGWNANETTLTPAALANPASAAARFGLLRTVPLDAQVDAQPLLVPKAVIAGDPNPGSHDVLFVATENNSVYAIDPTRGTVLKTRNLGTAVPRPLHCTNNAATVGITGTPVIDTSTNSLYVVAYVVAAAGPQYVLHRLALRDFSDMVPPRTVAATHALTNGGSASFAATYQRQRAALLLSDGAVYAAFASFCDFSASHSRGWLIGWRADTLAPLQTTSVPQTAVTLLPDRQATSPRDFFLSSIWMSGAGPAVDRQGNIYVVTGNSDPSGTTYNGVTNIQNSLVKFNPSASAVISVFTPNNEKFLDADDFDFGSGGVLVLPKSIAGLPDRLAVAAGKFGTMYLMNRDSLGGYRATGPDNVIGTAQILRCWCAPSYFELQGVPHLVSSGGNLIRTWSLRAGAGGPLVAGPGAFVPVRIQDQGAFTTVSSNGGAGVVIWTVNGPLDAAPSDLTLRAFTLPVSTASNAALIPLYTGVAGTWPNVGANANLVPVVANGLVYVASYRSVSIFGLGGH